MGLFGVVPPANAGGIVGGYGRFEPKRPYHFKVAFYPGVSAPETGFIRTMLGTGGTPQAESLAYSLYKIPRPAFTVQPNTIKHGNETFKIAGRNAYAPDNFNTEHYDLIAGNIKDGDVAPTDSTGSSSTAQPVSASGVIYEWMNYMQEIRSGNQNYANAYKGAIVLALLTPNGLGVTERWKYEGCFPTGIQFDDNDYTADDSTPMKIQVTWSVDKCFRLPISGVTADTSVNNTTPAEGDDFKATTLDDPGQ